MQNRKNRVGFGVGAAVALVLGAVGVFGLAGCESETTESVNPLTSSLEDDAAGPEVRFRFDVAAYRDDSERQQGETLYSSHAAFLRAHPDDGLPSVQTIGTYTKQLDDTIYAGVELALQDGVGKELKPKRQILEGALAQLLATRSADADAAATYVAVGLRLGGAKAQLPAELEVEAKRAETEFLKDTPNSKPFAFYTWSKALEKIWQQDRFLQGGMSPAPACALASAIAAEPARKTEYERLVKVYGKLTNPVTSLAGAVANVAEGKPCGLTGNAPFLGRSRTPEVEFFVRKGVTNDYMNVLIDAIQTGELDLTPKASDGWYAHQLFALETLLVTDRSEERARIAFTARYKRRMREAFATMMTQHRETHAKQADTMGVSATATPGFSVEPLATVYVRHARGYVFLERALESLLGAELLDSGRAHAAGGDEESLRSRLHRARDIHYGLYMVAASQLQLDVKLTQDGDPLLGRAEQLQQHAREWLTQLPGDPVADQDARVLVPIEVSPERATYWAVIGVRGTLASYSYVSGGELKVPEPEDESRYWLPTEQMIEVTTSPEPLTREEFRALCDRERTPEAIRAAMERR